MRACARDTRPRVWVWCVVLCFGSRTGGYFFGFVPARVCVYVFMQVYSGFGVGLGWHNGCAGCAGWCIGAGGGVVGWHSVCAFWCAGGVFWGLFGVLGWCRVVVAAVQVVWLVVIVGGGVVSGVLLSGRLLGGVLLSVFGVRRAGAVGGLVRLFRGVGGAGVVGVVGGWDGFVFRVGVDAAVFEDVGVVVVDGRVLGVALGVLPVLPVRVVEFGSASSGLVLVGGSSVGVADDGVVGLWRDGPGEGFVSSCVWSGAFSDWGRWLRRLWSAVSDDPGRPVLQCVEVSVDGAGLFRGAASDSYRLVVDRLIVDPDYEPVDSPVGGVGSGSLVLPFAALRAFGRMVSAAGGVKAAGWPMSVYELGGDGDGKAKVLLVCGPVEMVVTCLETPAFPDWSKLVPEVSAWMVGIDDPVAVRIWLNKVRKGLARKDCVLQVQVRVDDDHGAELLIGDKDRRVLMRHRVGLVQLEPAASMSPAAEATVAEVVFNAQFLADALGCFTSPVRLSRVPYQPVLSPWTVTSCDRDDGRLVVLSPVRPSK